MSRKNMLDLFTEVTGNRHGKLSLGDHSGIATRNVRKEKCVNFIFKGYIFITYIFLGIGVDDSMGMNQYSSPFASEKPLVISIKKCNGF